MRTHFYLKLVILNAVLAAVAWSQAKVKREDPTPAPARGSVQDEAGKSAKLFAAQMRLRETDAKIKQADQAARLAREEAETTSSSAKAVLAKGKPKNVSEQKAAVDARRAAVEAEVRAETAQIALEEATLDQALKDDPSLADLVAAQRNDIAVRKKMLAIRAKGAADLLPERKP